MWLLTHSRAGGRSPSTAIMVAASSPAPSASWLPPSRLTGRWRLPLPSSPLSPSPGVSCLPHVPTPFLQDTLLSPEVRRSVVTTWLPLPHPAHCGLWAAWGGSEHAFPRQSRLLLQGYDMAALIIHTTAGTHTRWLLAPARRRRRKLWLRDGGRMGLSQWMSPKAPFLLKSHQCDSQDRGPL